MSVLLEVPRPEKAAKPSPSGLKFSFPNYEWVKRFDRMVETLFQSEEHNQPKQNKQEITVMKPISYLKKEDKVSGMVFIALILAFTGLGLVSFFLTREYRLHKSTVAQLQESEQ